MDIEIEGRKNNIALSVIVHLNNKYGMMQVVWPPIFRGIEQPDEEHPSKALAKLKEKFMQVYPQPFYELKKLETELGLSSEIVDFLEKPLDCDLDTLAYKVLNSGGISLNPFKCKPVTESEFTLEQKKEVISELNNFIDGIITPPTAVDKSRIMGHISAVLNIFREDLENEKQKHEQKLGEGYRAWLAQQYGGDYDGYIGGWGNLGQMVWIKPEEADYLRRGEVVHFEPMCMYDPNGSFDMHQHNREALLSVYEEGLGSGFANFTDYSVLVAYGRNIAMKETMEEIDTIVKRLKLYEGEYLKGTVTRENFAKLIQEK